MGFSKKTKKMVKYANVRKKLLIERSKLLLRRVDLNREIKLVNNELAGWDRDLMFGDE